MSDELLFLGQFDHSLDSQGRLAIPKPWRSKNEDTRFFLFPGRHRVLQLVPFESFKEFLNKAKKISFANADAALALARFGSKAQECRCDKQGRIPIPQRLADYAGLKDQAVLIGAVSTIQIWEPNKWEQSQIADESYLDEVERISAEPDDLTNMLKKTLGGTG